MFESLPGLWRVREVDQMPSKQVWIEKRMEPRIKTTVFKECERDACERKQRIKKRWRRTVKRHDRS